MNNYTLCTECEFTGCEYNSKYVPQEKGTSCAAKCGVECCHNFKCGVGDLSCREFLAQRAWEEAQYWENSRDNGPLPF